MASDSNEFENELRKVFLEEASQLLGDAERCFLALEATPEDSSLIEQIFRLAHNLKGSAKAVGFSNLSEFTHHFESYLLRIKNGELAVTSQVVNLLLRSSDHIGVVVAALKEDIHAVRDHSALLQELITARAEKAPAAADFGLHADEPTHQPAPDPAAYPSRELWEEQETTQASPVLAASKDPSGFTEFSADAVADELAPSTAQVAASAAANAPPLPASPPASAATPAANTPAAAAGSSRQEESIRVNVERIDRLLNFVGEMVILQTVLREQVAVVDSNLLRKTVHQMGKVTKEVQDLSMSLRMVALKSTFQKMQRIVRDTSQLLGKAVHLELQGEDTELDKTVLEKLSDPLVHLVRNAVDHGIEAPEARLAAGKPAMGTLQLRAYHQSGKLVIEIRDDGSGLDAHKLRTKALEKGLIKAGAVISDQEAYQLIFRAGFSTKAVATDVSGRGVGMDVVRTNVEQLQGEISLSTELGKGTCFLVQLPLTLAIIDGMSVSCDQERYVIPLSHVHESVRMDEVDVHPVSGVGDMYSLRGEHMPLYRLTELMGKPQKAARPGADLIAIVTRTQGQPFAILVDDIIGQHQVVIKQLGAEYKDVRGFSGSAIMGDGRAALILELQELVARYKSKGPATPRRRVA